VFLLDERYASLARYFSKQKNIYKCPADNRVARIQGNYGWTERVRSIAGNVYCGGTKAQIDGGPSDPLYVPTPKPSMMVNPGPAENWMYLDEHPDSINDAGFFSPMIDTWIDLPSNMHNGAAGVAFADGHSEIHKWQASVLTRKFTFGGFSSWNVGQADKDVRWLRSKTQRKPGAI